MREQTGHEPAGACARAADLVAYLYGESDAEEARDFRQHLNACAHCREELADFGEVRVRVGEWRAEALAGAPALGLSGAFAAAAAGPAVAPSPRSSSSTTRARSARAALREFFALSPPWLRGATAAALVAFVALAALALAPARTVTLVERVEVPASVEEVEALVRERVREERAAADAPATSERAKPEPRLEQAASAPRKRPAPRATPRGRRATEDEESLPRLSDLLSGVY